MIDNFWLGVVVGVMACMSSIFIMAWLSMAKQQHKKSKDVEEAIRFMKTLREFRYEEKQKNQKD